MSRNRIPIDEHYREFKKQIRILGYRCLKNTSTFKGYNIVSIIITSPLRSFTINQTHIEEIDKITAEFYPSAKLVESNENTRVYQYNG